MERSPDPNQENVESWGPKEAFQKERSDHWCQTLQGTCKTGTEQVSVGKLPGDLGESNSRDNGWQGRMWRQGALLMWPD